jgi:surface antigen
MNPALLLAVSSLSKKQIYFVLTTLVVIVSLPIMSVFALGSSALSFLSNSSNSAVSNGSYLYQGSLLAKDTYAWGNCTYWVFLLRQQASDPIPNSWGNAADWASNASHDGYLVDDTPAVGAIMQTSLVDNGLGHVAYVEGVDPSTGAWTISEMNVKGLDVVDTQTYQASAATGFNFIHDKEF